MTIIFLHFYFGSIPVMSIEEMTAFKKEKQHAFLFFVLYDIIAHKLFE